MLNSIQASWFVPLFFVLSLLTGSAKADTLVIEDGLFFFSAADVLDDIVVRDGGILFLDGSVVEGCIRIEQGERSWHLEHSLREMCLLIALFWSNFRTAMSTGMLS